MPSLQLDVAATYDLTTRRALAARMGAAYAEVMGTVPEIVTVVIRDLGDGGVWRCTAAEPAPAALLMCDVRRGRDVETRAELCRRLVAVCEEAAGVDPATLKIELTQHAGDEMWHPHLGGFNRDWEGDEGY
jgi:phenylpyruvate tautomerase PptA (4-oxalocrotonate tautomerase family)